jgi:hypothetical protein
MCYKTGHSICSLQAHCLELDLVTESLSLDEVERDIVAIIKRQVSYCIANDKMDVSQRYGFVDDYELVAAIDRFTYDNGSTQILAVSRARK